MKWFRALLPLLFVAIAGQAQTPLDQYVEMGLVQNLRLQQQTFVVEQADLAVDEAKGLFWPSLSVDARYSRAGGGRAITFPVGDLLNPVYNTLNQWLAMQGQPPSFPTIENEVIPFLRKKEQETKLRLVQPLYQPVLKHNRAIQTHLATAERADLAVQRRQLVAQIKTSYFNYLQAIQAVKIYEQALALVQENVRVNEALVRHDQATNEVVFRAQAELKAVEQQVAEAQKNVTLAQAFFNQLLHRPLDAPIVLPNDEPRFVQDRLSRPVQPLSTPSLLTNREEIQQLDAALLATAGQRGVAQSDYLPQVAVVVDYGLQGETYQFKADGDFWMASVVLQWNLFDGFQKRARVQQAEAATRALEAQRADAVQQIQLHVLTAERNLTVARQAIETAAERVKSAEESYRLIARRYREGLANQVTLLDARTTLTNAQLNLVITQYTALIRYAEWERATGTYTL